MKSRDEMLMWLVANVNPWPEHGLHAEYLNDDRWDWTVDWVTGELVVADTLDFAQDVISRREWAESLHRLAG